jgi:hypothetical protein
VRARRDNARGSSLKSAALTSLIVLAGFAAVTPLILFAAFDRPTASVASDKRGEITASIVPIAEPPVLPADPPAAVPEDVNVAPAAAAKADVAPVAEITTSDINPPIYVPAALPDAGGSKSNRVPDEPPETPRGFVSVHVKAPQPDEAPGADFQTARVAEAAPGDLPGGASTEPAEEESQPLGGATETEDEPFVPSATEPTVPAATEAPAETISTPGEEPEGDAAAVEEPAEANVAATEPEHETEIAITKPQPKPAKMAAKKALASSRASSVRSAVNLRSKPSKRGSVIAVIPRGSKIEVIDCKYWCNVKYKGKRGWVAKSYIRGATS